MNAAEKAALAVLTTSALTAAQAQQAAVAALVADPTPAPMPVPTSTDFAARSAGALRAFDFAPGVDIGPDARARGYANFGYSGDPSSLVPVIDASQGLNALRFDVPGMTGSAASCEWYLNFSPDYKTQFGARSSFFLQWRQRFNQAMCNVLIEQASGNGQSAIKQVIIAEQDTATRHFDSCDTGSIVLTTYLNWRVPMLYHSCHADYDLNDYRISGHYQYQNIINGVPATVAGPFCDYQSLTVGGGSIAPPNVPAACFGWYPDEWMTFMVSVDLGEIGQGPTLMGSNAYQAYLGSRVRLWMGRENQAMRLVHDVPTHLWIEDPTLPSQYGKAWFGPYMTGKDPALDHPLMQTWIAEVIVSKDPILDPVTGALSPLGATPTPTPIGPEGEINVALASAGAVASASSTISAEYPASAVIDNERAGTKWGAGGGWNDGTSAVFPDWVQITFNGAQTIDRIVVYTVQDNLASPVEPTDTLVFTKYGIVDFSVQGWNGSAWVTLATVTGNNLVKRTVAFTAVTTDRIRINVTNALAGYSRITEIEAWGTPSGVVVTPPPPTSTLSSLSPGQIRALGSFNAGTALTTARLEYGSLVTDAKRNRILLLGGGGHTAGVTNDAGAFTGNAPFDVLYPSDTTDQQALGFITDTLIFSATNHHAAVHTFLGGCVSGDRYYWMNDGGYGSGVKYGMAVCDLTTMLWTAIHAPIPWYYVTSAEADPISGKVIVIGLNIPAGYAAQAWLFDPGANTISAPIGLAAFTSNTHPPDIIYDPVSDTFHCIEGTTGAVHELRLDRTNFANSTYTLATVSGDIPPAVDGESSAAFARTPSGSIVGFVTNGTYRTYDPTAKAWALHQLKNEDGTASTDSMSYAYLALDPVSGCVVFMNQSNVFAFKP